MHQLQRSWVRSQHPSAQWNLRGSRWNSAEYCTNKKKSPKKINKIKKCSVWTVETVKVAWVWRNRNLKAKLRIWLWIARRTTIQTFVWISSKNSGTGSYISLVLLGKGWRGQQTWVERGGRAGHGPQPQEAVFWAENTLMTEYTVRKKAAISNLCTLLSLGVNTI